MRTCVGGITLITTLIACILAILLHEIFHGLAARLFKMSLWYVRPTAIGLKARLKGKVRSFKKLTLIYVSGPLGNLLIATIFYPFHGFFKDISDANLAIGLFNILPIYPLDGGQIFLIFLYKLMGSNLAFRHLRKISVTLRVVLYLTGILQIILFKNPSLLIAAIILPGTRLLEETVSIMKLENLLNRKQRIITRKIYSARHLVVMADCSLGDIVQKLDYDRFHIIYILNEKMEIIGQITEQQIIKALETSNASDRIDDIFSLGL